MKKIIFFQIFDYRDVYFAIENNQAETYVSQKQFIEFTSSLMKSDDVSAVCIVSLLSSGKYDQIMPNGVRVIGIPFLADDPKQTQIKANKFVDLFAPTHAIIQVPLLGLLAKCIKNKIKTCLIIADSFTGTGLRGFIWTRMFAWLLNNKYVELVSNHNYPAANLLKSFGVKPNKIIPWDQSWDQQTDKFAVKVLNSLPDVWKFFYAGRILTEKGVGDIIQAISLLKQNKVQACAVFVGSGNITDFEKQAADLGISENIAFLGSVAHAQVLSGMRNADIVIVPSQIKSSEGMPCTIYESFIVKTPLIISDHPMMKKAIKNCVFFKANDPGSLVEAVNQLSNDLAVYNKLSADSAAALSELIVPFDSIQILDHWLSGKQADKQWLYEHSLKKLNKNY
ncbi:MAG: glycosyltransferase [Candidatus Omnitrophica bacterium]|nr:glycosyltransferase [Candidatus Omnitrophota bacterium]